MVTEFAIEEQSVWKDVLRDKYEMEGKWTTNAVNSLYGVSL